MIKYAFHKNCFNCRNWATDMKEKRWIQETGLWDQMMVKREKKEEL